MTEKSNTPPNSPISNLSSPNLPSLAETISQLRADKRHGQNFLMDDGLCDQIVRAIPNQQFVREIGPGPGGLTRALLAAGHQIEAYEVDPRMVKALQPLIAANSNNLTVIQGDARQAPALLRPHFIASNLPFHLASELWLGWLNAPLNILGMVLMFQHEVAERLCAAPNSKAYGRLSVISQYLFQIEPWLEVDATFFAPPPKVNAMVIRAMPKPDIAERLGNLPALNRLTTLAFMHKRKKLSSTLKGKIPKLAETFAQAEIDPNRRAETLCIEEFLRLLELVDLP